ncbi:MAG: class I SAM-dependent methyltransferase, partial [Bacteroidia bacterium]
MYKHTSEYYDLIYSFKNYKEESDKIAALVTSLRPDVQTVLDVACGTAEHHRFFPDAWEIEGLDLDEGMLKVARAKFPDRAFHHGDMADFQLSRQFDAVLCLFSSIGYLETNEQLEAAVRCFADHLAPNGILLVEPWFRKENYRPGKVHALTAEGEGVKVMRMSYTGIAGRRSILEFHYMI